MDEMESRRMEVVDKFIALLAEEGEDAWTVECGHVEKVKSWAPGVYHCVLDVSIEPKCSNQGS